MTWSQDFVTAISAPEVDPRYLLESVAIGTFDPTSTPLKLSSFTAPGYTCGLVRDGSSVSYGTLSPSTWTRSYGTLTAALSHVEIRDRVARGQAVQLRIGFPGWSLAKFERVWLGVVRNLRWTGGRWYLDCTELPGALQNRFDDVSGQQNLFFNLPAATKVDGGYDPVVDDPTPGLPLLDTSDFEANNSGNYCARITPSGANFYYVTATGKSSSHLTGTTGGAFDSPLNNRKTPTVVSPTPTAADQDDVDAIAWINAHPLIFARGLLLATGTGDNGPNDVLPESWGWGIPYGLVDVVDIDAFKALSEPASGSTTWDFLIDHSQADGLSFVSEQIRPGGFFVSQHQGCLTARAVIGVDAVRTPGFVSIDDSDLMALDYEAWDGTSAVEYRNVRVLGYNDTNPSITTEDNLATRPTRTSHKRSLPQVFSAVAAGWTDEVAGRLAIYDQRIPERLTLTCRGWRVAVATMGDVVSLTTQYLTTRVAANSPTTSAFHDTPVLVVGGGPDWFGSTTKLEVLAGSLFGELE